MMTLIASSPNLIIESTLRARGLAPLDFFSGTLCGIAVLAAALVFMLKFGHNMLSRRLTAEDRGSGQPSAFDLAASYGLADKSHRFQVSASSPLIGRAVARAELLYRFGVIVVGFETSAYDKSQFLRATPGTTFEPSDATVVVGSQT